jgi:hypothetical protein
MNSLSGFIDSDAWMRTDDGTIVGRARDRSYKEILRHGVTIDQFMDSYIDDGTVVNETVVNESECSTHMEKTNITKDYDCNAWEFDNYFGPSIPRNVARKARVSKSRKFAPKSKARTVASRIFIDDLTIGDHVKMPFQCCDYCGMAQEFDAYPDPNTLLCASTCERCNPEWVSKLNKWIATYRTTMAAIEEERAAIRLEKKIHNARYM